MTVHVHTFFSSTEYVTIMPLKMKIKCGCQFCARKCLFTFFTLIPLPNTLLIIIRGGRSGSKGLNHKAASGGL